MKKIFIIALLVLAGCTSSHYTPANIGMEKSLSDCKAIAFKKYNDIHANDNKAGAVAGGVLLGPVGAVLGDTIAGSGDNQPKIDLNAEIENCMKKKGYSGVSSGYN